MKRTITLGGLASLNLILVFIYQWYIISFFGASSTSDSFFAAMAVPQVIMAIVSSTVVQVLVPGLSVEYGTEKKKICWSLLQLLGIVAIVFFSFLIATAQFWMPLIVYGFDQDSKILTISLVQIQLIGIGFAVIVCVLQAYHFSNNRFIVVEVYNFIANLTCFGFLLLFLTESNIIIAAWGLVLRQLLQVILMIWAVGRYQKPEYRHSAIRTSWERIKPLLFGATFYKTDIILDRFLASLTTAGNLSIFHLAQQLYNAGNVVLNKSITSPSVPMLAKNAHEGNWAGTRNILRKKLLLLGLIVSVVLAIQLFFGESILFHIFAFKNFGQEEVFKLWQILLCLTGVLIGGAIGQQLSSSFYAQGETIIPTKVGIVGYIFGIIFKIVGFYFWGIFGLAAGATFYYLLNSVVLYFMLNKTLSNKQLYSAT
jgi:putative peptidoglycan lipid II flippase